MDNQTQTLNQVRAEEIHNKGFDMTDSYREYRTAIANEYKKVKVGNRNLNDVILDLDYYQKVNIPGQKGFCKADIYKAIADHDLPELRRISNLFYSINGIYERTCNYFAFYAPSSSSLSPVK